VRYDTNRLGDFTKTITLTTNETTPSRVLTIRGKILDKSGVAPPSSPSGH
jgi:hypothetical protein